MTFSFELFKMTTLWSNYISDSGFETLQKPFYERLHKVKEYEYDISQFVAFSPGKFDFVCVYNGKLTLKNLSNVYRYQLQLTIENIGNIKPKDTYTCHVKHIASGVFKTYTLSLANGQRQY